MTNTDSSQGARQRPVLLTLSLHAAFDLGNQVDVIYTDFSKAFDSLDHNALLFILDRLGVDEPLLSWFGSYLSDRRQFVSLFGKSSERYPEFYSVAI